MDFTNLSHDKILEAFLNRWPASELSQMNLEEYVSVGNSNTFAQWLDTHTARLGNIKGTNSSKFGIYKPRKSNSTSKMMVGDGAYLWSKKFGKTANEAFLNIRTEVERVALLAGSGNFEDVDDSKLHQFVKWKIAYLYSNGRIVPVFAKEVLLRIVQSFSNDVDNKTPLSTIYRIIIDNKPVHQSTFQYARLLYNKFGKNADLIKTNKKQGDKGRKPRASVALKNTEKLKRASMGEVEVSQRHNEIQNKFAEMLRKQYGKQNVYLEENYVDIKVRLPDKNIFYEVKSDAFASDCIKQALGQLLGYVYNDPDEKNILLRIVGENPPTGNEKAYIEYLKTKLNFDFDYISVNTLGKVGVR